MLAFSRCSFFTFYCSVREKEAAMRHYEGLVLIVIYFVFFTPTYRCLATGGLKKRKGRNGVYSI